MVRQILYAFNQRKTAIAKFSKLLIHESMHLPATEAGENAEQSVQLDGGDSRRLFELWLQSTSL